MVFSVSRGPTGGWRGFVCPRQLVRYSELKLYASTGHQISARRKKWEKVCVCQRNVLPLQPVQWNEGLEKVSHFYLDYV